MGKHGWVMIMFQQQRIASAIGMNNRIRGMPQIADNAQFPRRRRERELDRLVGVMRDGNHLHFGVTNQKTITTTYPPDLAGIDRTFLVKGAVKGPFRQMNGGTAAVCQQRYASQMIRMLMRHQHVGHLVRGKPQRRQTTGGFPQAEATVDQDAAVGKAYDRAVTRAATAERCKIHLLYVFPDDFKQCLGFFGGRQGVVIELHGQVDTFVGTQQL